MQFNSILRCIELFIFLRGIQNHFQINTEDFEELESRYDDQSKYGSSPAKVKVVLV